MALFQTEDHILQRARAFQPACVLMAGAELGVYDALTPGPLTAGGLVRALGTDPRATAMLADALAALGLLEKEGRRYRLAPGVSEFLTETGPRSVLPMVRHLANCLRSWAQLAEVVKSGHAAERRPSVRGPAADLAAFIEAMENASRSVASQLVRAIGPPAFGHLLDVGGGPGTWTIAFLRAAPGARATLFDRPDVIPIARKHLLEAGLGDRVDLVGGDYTADEPLPPGADLAWVSAIVHQHPREQNRDLLAKVREALVPGGRVLIRDVVMEENRVEPAEGALFAINMLVNTPGGGTFTSAELRDDLLAAGYRQPRLLRRGEYMDSVIEAQK